MAERKLFDKLTKMEFINMIYNDFESEVEVHESLIELEKVEVVVPRCSNLRPRWFYLDGYQVDISLILYINI